MQRKTFLLLVVLGAGIAACETKDPCDGIDNDGDGYYDEDHELDEVIRPFFADVDTDGFGNSDFVLSPPIWACAAPEGMVSNNFDCDDEDPAVNPDATEACNDLDDNCDGAADENVGDTYWTDADGDGYGDPDSVVVSCAVPSGAVDNDDDCDDTDSTTFPDADELCDGVDNDCDEVVPDDETTDADGDGFVACADCDDAEAAIYPGAFEVCDGVDGNCDGALDDADTDGSGTADCSELLMVVSAPFAAVTSTCDGDGLPYPDSEVAGVTGAADEVGLGAVSAVEEETTGMSLEDLTERPIIVVLNGGLPWGQAFFDTTLTALDAAHAAGVPVYFIGDDVADGMADYPALAALLGLENLSSSGGSDSVNILDPDHPVVHGAHGDVIGFWAEADMDVADLAADAHLIGEQSSSGAPALLVSDTTARTVVQLFAAAAAHDGCPQVDEDRTGPLVRNALEWLGE